MLLLDGDVHDIFLSLFIVSFVLADDLKMDYANTPDGVVMSKWTIPQLKTFLKARGARRTGKKANVVTLYVLKYIHFFIIIIILLIFIVSSVGPFAQGTDLL